MKKINAAYRLGAILFCFCLPASLIAQKNYISIESGILFGGSDNKLESQMKSSGFGDKMTYSSDLLDYYFSDLFAAFGLSTSYSNQYPKISSKGLPVWIRYGRELKNKNIIELSYGKIHCSTVEGFDVTGVGESFDGNILNYTTTLSALTAHYIFSTKNKSAGIGFGPAFLFNTLTREANNVTNNKNIFQVGISGTANWRFINGKVFFMSLRGDAILLAPATIDAITLTSSKGYESTFNSTKVNSFIGDLTVSVGFKF